MNDAWTLSGTALRSRQRTATEDRELHRKVAAGVDRLAGGRAAALSLIGLEHDDGTLGSADELRAAARAMRARTITRLPEILETFVMAECEIWIFV